MQISTSESAIKSLEIEGVEHVFGILGSYLADMIDVVGQSPNLTYVGVRHEEHAVHMANAYARAGGKMAVTMSQVGAGAANQVHGLAAALKAHAPLLAITGGLPSSEIDTQNRHEFDQLGVMRNVTKWSGRVARVDRMPEYIQRAFRIALTPPYGPVHLEVPKDILYEGFEWEPPGTPWSYRAKYQSMPSPEAVSEVADKLGSSQRPIFVVGPGGESEAAWTELAALSERESIPLTTSFGHNSAIPQSPLALGSLARQGSKAAMELLGEADLVVILGSRMASNSTTPVYGFKYWPKDALIIHVDSDPLNVGRWRSIDLGIAADATAFASALRGHLEGSVPQNRDIWRARAVAAKENWLAERAKKATPTHTPDGRYLRPAAVYETIGRTLGRDALFVAEVGATSAASFGMIDYGQPGGFIYCGSMAGLGFAMPGALGAKLARPDRPVVSLLGDGAFTLSLPALVTAVDHHIPVRIIVGDNQAWGAEKNHQLRYFEGRVVGGDLPDTDVVEIAEGIGAEAVRVESIEELEHELSQEPEGVPKVIVTPHDPDDFPEPARPPTEKPVRYIYT